MGFRDLEFSRTLPMSKLVFKDQVPRAGRTSMLRAMGNVAAGLVLALLVIVGVQVYGAILVPVGGGGLIS